MITQFKIFEELDKDRQRILDDDLFNYSKNKSSLQKMRDLIKSGANVNFRQDRGWTPLMRASYFMFHSGVKLLIENGAEINLTNDDGFSAIMLVAANTYNFVKSKGVKEIIYILIENDADLNIQNSKGQDIFDINKHLHEYISGKYPEKYQEYLERKDANKYNL